ncbi:hypothetical protein FOZ62_032107 [Perkinsus olseni]|nr:hypothetical protein FOZ62_032107 [Perkinsus olseni]
MTSTCDCLCAPGFQGARCETKVTDADRILEREAIIDFSGDPVIPEQDSEPDAAMDAVQNMVVEKKPPVMLILGAVLVFFLFAGAAYYYQKEQQKKIRPGAVDPDAFMAEVLAGPGEDALDLYA